MNIKDKFNHWHRVETAQDIWDLYVRLLLARAA